MFSGLLSSPDTKDLANSIPTLCFPTPVVIRTPQAGFQGAGIIDDMRNQHENTLLYSSPARKKHVTPCEVFGENAILHEADNSPEDERPMSYGQTSNYHLALEVDSTYGSPQARKPRAKPVAPRRKVAKRKKVEPTAAISADQASSGPDDEHKYTKHGTRRVARSGGCWTCKCRRKKCDESQPHCLACANLGLRCDGYAPERPSYMCNAEENESYRAILSEQVRAFKQQNKDLRRF